MFTIVVAAGTSSRYGSNKLHELIGDETVLDRSVRIALLASDGVVVVTDPKEYSNDKVFAVVSGGSTRSESVANGLAVIPKDIDIIAVHDAARPGATVELFNLGRSLVEQGHVGAIPAIEVVDTIKKIEESRAIFTVERSQLRAVQTPQIFNAQTLRQAYKQGIQDTDDAALVEALGAHVVLFEGTQQNRKITTPEDLIYVRALLSENNTYLQLPRVGSGYDIHPFGLDKNKKLILGGVEIDYQGLDGHSDSDAIAHALTDALLSAIGAPDLGTLFSANDPANKGISSFVFLERAITLVYNDRYFLSNVSIIVNAEKPKLASHIDDIKKNLAEALAKISTSQTIISVTPKHGEGVGEIGRGEAIAVYATVQLIPLD